MAITWDSAGAGVSTESSGAALSPLCPATVTAGDILIVHTAWEGTTTGPTDPPTGFTKLGASPYNVGSAATVARHWIFGKIADGTEDGAAVALGAPAVTTQRAARVHRFLGRVSGSITDLVPAASFSSLIGDTDPTGPTVVTTIAGALAIAAVYQNDNNTLETFASSSDVWTERGTAGGYIFALAPGGVLDLLTATPAANPGTVSGGAMTVTNDPWGVIGFEIRPSVPVVPDNLLADDIATGTPTLTNAVIGQIHGLNANDVATDAPTLTNATLGQKHVLLAEDIAIGAPTLTSPALAEASEPDVLTADDIDTGSPTLTVSAIGQIHALTADDLASGTPTLTSPALAENAGVDALLADDIEVGLPTLSSPVLSVIDNAVAAPESTEPEASNWGNAHKAPKSLSKKQLDELIKQQRIALGILPPDLPGQAIAEPEDIADEVAAAVNNVTQMAGIKIDQKRIYKAAYLEAELAIAEYRQLTHEHRKRKHSAALLLMH